MPKFDVTEEEWKIAHNYLDTEPDGSKLPFSSEINQAGKAIPRQRFMDTPKPYQTFHSFIKKDGKLIAFQRGGIHEGSCNKTKYAQNENLELYVVKLENNSDFENEIDILSDLGLARGIWFRTNKSKKYVFMQALGKSLKTLYSEIQTKNVDYRLNIAIQLCWKLHRLHEGYDSLTGTSYAHLDIKPDNITLTEDGKVHLIDFGLSEKQPKLGGKQKTNAHRYVAYRASKNQVITKEQYDVIALKRVIHMPDSLYGGAQMFISADRLSPKDRAQLLTAAELSQLGLNEYINTFATEGTEPDYTQDKTSALMLCALLICAKQQLNFEYHKVINDQILMHAIIGFYFNGQLKNDLNLFSDRLSVNLMAALNILDSYAQYSLDSEDECLKIALNQASSFDITCALLNLKQKGLDSHYEIILQSSELAKAINLTCKYPSLNNKQNLLTIFQNQNKTIAKAIIHLQPLFLDSHFSLVIKDVLEDAFLAEAVINVSSEECKVCMVRMLELRVFTTEQIINSSKNEQLAKAINLIWVNSHIQREDILKLMKLMDTETDVVEAALKMNANGSWNEYEQATILSSIDKCRALNYLFPTAQNHNNELRKALIYNNNALSIFNTLHSRFGMVKLCQRAFQDISFCLEMENIIKKSFFNEITPEMLANNEVRIYLNERLNSENEFIGFKHLLSKLDEDQLTYKFLCSIDFKLIDDLKSRGLDSWIDWLIKYPEISYSLEGLVNMKEQKESGYYLESAVLKLPAEKRFVFIKQTTALCDLKSLKSDKHHRQKIKLLLSANEKQEFSKLIYSNEELENKNILKKVKSRIKKTKWSFGLFDPAVSIGRNNLQLVVPKSVLPHINALYDASTGEKNYVEVLCEIKRVGKEQAERSKGKFTRMKHGIFGKSITEQYFDLFATEECFKSTFG